MSIARCSGLRRSQSRGVPGGCGGKGRSSSCIGSLLGPCTAMLAEQRTKQSIHNGAGAQQVARRSEGAAPVLLVQPRGGRVAQVGPGRRDGGGAPFRQAKDELQSAAPIHVAEHIQCQTLKRVLLTDYANAAQKSLDVGSVSSIPCTLSDTGRCRRAPRRASS